MKRWVTCVLCCMAAWGLDNSIRIHDAGGAAQPNRPYTVLMVFMEGEFPNGTFPKPRVDGIAPSSWQADVKSRWPDGSVLSAFVSFPVTLAANGSVKVDFVPDTNACHLGSQSTCEAAALDQAGMLNFMSGAWNAEIRGTANSISYSANARTMLAAGAWRYWLRGPVVTRVIVEDIGFAYDFGWQWDGTNWQAPSGGQYKSAHPMFELSFYPGWSGVETGFRVENPWWTKWQTLKFDLAFLAGSPLSTLYSKATYDLQARAAVSYYGWSGTAPGEILVDRNLPYLVATRILPPYDTSIRAASTILNYYESNWNAFTGVDDQGRRDPRNCTTGMSVCAYVKTSMPDTGDHPNFGIIPGFHIAYLYVMGDSQFSVAQRKSAYEKMILGSGEAAITVPVLARESRTDMSPSYRNYLDWPSDPATPSFGRIKSISAHPDGRFFSYTNAGAYPSVTVCSNCPAATHPWVPDAAHWPALFSMPYLLTGRYTFLASLQQSAAVMLSYDNPIYNRHYDFGILYDSANPRIPARGLKELFWAYLLSPDGPERSYFAGKLKNTDAAYEGVFVIRDGIYQDQVAGDCRGTAQTQSGTWTWTSSTTGGPNGLRKIFYMITDAQHGLYSVSSVQVNGVAKTFGIYGQDTGKDWYWIPGARLLIQDSSAAPLASSDTLTMNAGIGKSATPWCMGYNLVRWVDNPLPLLGVGSASFTSGGGVTGTLPFHVDYLAMHMGWARQSGALRVNGKRLFEYSAAKFGRFYVDGMLHPRRPVLYLGDYHMPLHDNEGLITTWERFIAAKNPPVALTADISANATSFTINCRTQTNGCVNVPGSDAVWKIDDEYIRTCAKSPGTSTTTFTVCPGGRGIWGTRAAPHTTASLVNAEWRTMGDVLAGHTYPNLWVNVLAMYYDVTGALGSGLEAYQRAVGMGSGLEKRASDQRYALIPRVEPYNLRAITAPGKAEIHYEAPTQAACRYAVTPTDFVSPDDAGDEQDRGGLRTRRIVLSPLAPGAYRYRVTCGTGRKIGSFTVP